MRFVRKNLSLPQFPHIWINVYVQLKYLNRLVPKTVIFLICVQFWKQFEALIAPQVLFQEYLYSQGDKNRFCPNSGFGIFSCNFLTQYLLCFSLIFWIFFSWIWMILNKFRQTFTHSCLFVIFFTKKLFNHIRRRSLKSANCQ